MAARAKMNVQSFPRPPKLEKISRHIRITYKGQEIADTKDAYWVLETHHPPSVGAYDVNLVAYYLPRSSIKVPLTLARGRQSWCEWKGLASYWTLTLGGDSVAGRIWSYENPTSGFEPIRSHVSLYAGPWDCFVDGEKVEPQPGDFYGGWVTSEVEGIVKGRTGNLDPVI